MDQNETWHGGIGLGPGHIVLDGYPAPPKKRENSRPPPNFRPMSIVAKRSPISATAEPLLSSYFDHLFLFADVVELKGFFSSGR